ncbi:hypothetical protein AVEN_211130-1 [Araneus ventricosus]|uniref:Uncharacterized protein n=1 Tax=Araneus ventricosus TaxID=182803 RepID=A0A4Y2UUB1_ARAVE|nr:hypothetical protein AVEN_211130-1 [Araneus ventricosus]
MKDFSEDRPEIPPTELGDPEHAARNKWLIGLPSSPSRSCTRQGILNAYHWTQLCPLRQPQFTCDLPITNNSASQCTGNSVISSQVTNVSENTANDRQNPSTEASGPVY